MKKTSVRIIVITMAFCIAFSGMPFLTGTAEASAKAPKKSTLKVSLNSNNKPYLKWNKVSKPYNGYAVFKNGKVYKRFNKKTFAFTDTTAGDGQSNTYQIRTYKTTKKTKKVKQWYNKSTKKWQTKKPAKQYRGKRRTVKKKTYKYSYKSASNAVKITTKAHAAVNQDAIYVYVDGTGSPVDSATITVGKSKRLLPLSTSQRKASVSTSSSNITVSSDFVVSAKKAGTYTITYSLPQNNYWTTASKSITIKAENPTTGGNPTTEHTHSWSSWSTTQNPTTTSTGKKQRTCNSCGEVETETIPKLSSNIVNIKDIPNCFGKSDDGYNIGATVEFTDYLGKKRTFTKKRVNRWGDGEISISLTSVADVCEMCKDVDGEWTASGGTKMLNCHGATFNMSEFGEYTTFIYGDGAYTIPVYNCDKSKLEVIPESSSVEETTYSYEYNPKLIKKRYYKKNNYRLARAPEPEKTFELKERGGINYITIPFYTNAADSGEGLGIYTDIFTFTVKYNNKVVGTVKADSTKSYMNKNWTTSTCNKMSPVRKKSWEIAWKAVEGNPVDYVTDLNKICNYLLKNYKSTDDIYWNNDYLYTMNCSGGVNVLETYSIIQYDVYGFVTPNGGDSNHKSWSPLIMPDSHWNANGR